MLNALTHLNARQPKSETEEDWDGKKGRKEDLRLRRKGEESDKEGCQQA